MGEQLTAIVMLDRIPISPTLPNVMRGLSGAKYCEKYGREVRKFSMYIGVVPFGFGKRKEMLKSRWSGAVRLGGTWEIEVRIAKCHSRRVPT